MKRQLVIAFAVFAILAAACGGDSDGDTTPGLPGATGVSTPTTAASAPTATVSVPVATIVLEGPPAPPAAGTTFVVNVRLQGATNLAAFQFSPVFDANAVELARVTEGGFMGSTGRVPTCSLAVEPRPTFFCVTGGASPAGPSGDGLLAAIELRALAPGETTISLENVTATMPDARDIPVQASALVLTIF